MQEDRELTVDELKFEVQRRDFKIQALLEDIAKTRGENADMRVELTLLSNDNTFLKNMVQSQQQEQEASVVQEEPAADDSNK